MTLACEDANTRLVKVVTIVDVNVDDEGCIGISLLQIWFGQKSKFLLRL